MAEAELEKDGLREVAWKILSPDAKRRAVDMLKEVKGMLKRLACKAVGLARSSGNSMASLAATSVLRTRARAVPALR